MITDIIVEKFNVLQLPKGGTESEHMLLEMLLNNRIPVPLNLKKMQCL
jgi:hypothetical protein